MKKLQHFVAGLVIATIVYLLTNNLGYAGAAVMLAAAAKEVWDNRHPGHTEDIWDMMAFCAGWIPVALMSLVTP